MYISTQQNPRVTYTHTHNPHRVTGESGDTLWVIGHVQRVKFTPQMEAFGRGEYADYE